MSGLAPRSDLALLSTLAGRRRNLATPSVSAVPFLAFTGDVRLQPILARSNLFARPLGFAFPVIGLFALVGILLGARRARRTAVRNDLPRL